MSTSLNATVALRIGPLFIETLFKHYLERKTVTKDSKAREELLYDAAFTAFKMFLDAATRHTVEELQQFSNVRIPAPPWVHCVRLRIPMSSCTDAASYLIRALGGEDATRAFVGGVKWWQARGVQGVDAQWVCSKKDLEREERRLRELRREASMGAGLNGTMGGEEPAEGGEPVYSSGMDGMRCLMYMHGGGYYFGSVDQERYMMQRFARKMKGRVFAVDYRLAPQYPFPCAIQDCLAAYLYLIRPPAGVSHAPVPPNRIILGGDSAGGGLTLALLQIIRDTNLPMPGGAVLLSPWCDLTHSFPSVVENTATDILPAYGLSIHKPSTLWPPPPESLSTQVRNGLRARIRDLLHHSDAPRGSMAGTTLTQSWEGARTNPLHPTTSRGDTRLPPSPRSPSQTLNPHDLPSTTDDSAEPGREEPPGKALDKVDPRRPGPLRLTVDGKEVVIRSQIQLYATNPQLVHPLVSPVLGYMGGLCPLFIVVSDKEVLRDEILYLAHKAARPDKYPIKEETRAIYPHLNGVEARYGPTNVHLQVYDETSHVLPMFSFTTPAKYAFRAIAAFCVHITPSGITLNQSPSTSVADSPQSHAERTPSKRRRTSLFSGGKIDVSRRESASKAPRILPESPMATTPEEENGEWDFPDTDNEGKANGIGKGKGKETGTGTVANGGPAPGLPAAASMPLSNGDARMGKRVRLPDESHDASMSDPLGTPSTSKLRARFSLSRDSRTDGPRSFSLPSQLLRSRSAPHVKATADRERGRDGQENHQSREASEDVAGPRFGDEIPDEQVGRKAGDASVYEGQDGASPFDDHMIRERVSRVGTIRPLEPPEELPGCNLKVDDIGVIKETAAKRYLHGQALWDKKFHSTMRTVEKDRMKQLKREKKRHERTSSSFSKGKTIELDKEDASWGWGWAIEGEEPPPTSIVARRDTREARRLAKIADKSWEGEESEDDKWAGNRLWTHLADWLTGPGDKGEDGEQDGGAEESAGPSTGVRMRRRSQTVASLDGRDTKPKSRASLFTIWKRRSIEDPTTENKAVTSGEKALGI